MDSDHFLNGFWRFCPDYDDLGVDQQWFVQDNQSFLEEKTRAIVPSSWDRQTSKEFADFHGVAWYWRIFRVPPQCTDRPTSLHFDGVAHSATVYIDGTEIGAFQGSFIPFELDISAYIDNKDHFLAVRVDGRAETARVPAVPQVTIYGGIIKDVKIVSKDILIIDDRSIETILNYNEGTTAVRYAELTLSLYLRNRTDFDIKGTLEIEIHRDYVPVLQISREIEILKNNSRLSKTLIHIDADDLDLWTPEEPNLYNFKIRIANDELGEIIQLEDIIGIREIEATPEHISLNGKQIKLKGATVPLDHPLFGYTLPTSYIFDLLNQLKESGVNIIRPEQGAFDRVWIEAASRIGMLAINDIPLVSLSVIEKQSYFNLFAASMTFLPALAVYSFNPQIDQTAPALSKALVELEKMFTNRLDPSRYVIPAGDFGVGEWIHMEPLSEFPKDA